MAYKELYTLVALFILANIYLGALQEMSTMLDDGDGGKEDRILIYPGNLTALQASLYELRRFARRHPHYMATVIVSSIIYTRAFCLPSCQSMVSNVIL
jgi:hypothetical protein